MKLPNAERAFIDIAKLRQYSLDPTHQRGRHKARVFAAALGLTAEDAEAIRDVLLAAVLTNEAFPGENDQHGQRYDMDFILSGPRGQAVVRSGWIVRHDEDFPRLTTCYVL